MKAPKQYDQNFKDFNEIQYKLPSMDFQNNRKGLGHYSTSGMYHRMQSFLKFHQWFCRGSPEIPVWVSLTPTRYFYYTFIINFPMGQKNQKVRKPSNQKKIKNEIFSTVHPNFYFLSQLY